MGINKVWLSSGLLGLGFMCLMVGAVGRACTKKEAPEETTPLNVHSVWQMRAGTEISYETETGDLGGMIICDRGSSSDNEIGFAVYSLFTDATEKNQKEFRNSIEHINSWATDCGDVPDSWRTEYEALHCDSLNARISEIPQYTVVIEVAPKKGQGGDISCSRIKQIRMETIAANSYRKEK